MDEVWPENVGGYTITDNIFETEKSKVYSGYDQAGKRFAIKESKNHSQLENEFQLLTELDSSYIIKPINYLRIGDLSYIIFPNAQGGDLFDKLAQEGPFNEDYTRKVMRELFQAVDYLHSVGIIHRGITLENILIFYQHGVENYKLGGFSLAIKSPSSNERCGAAPYMCPEMIGNQQYDNKVDSWSLGIIMYALLTNTYPFHENNQQAEVDYSNLSSEASDLIRHLLDLSPNGRYSTEQALKHSFFINHPVE